MQAYITIHLNQPCTLPLGYHHIVQAALYQLMKEDNTLGSVYHDQGQHFDKRIYKSFTFGPLVGPYSIKDKMITFENHVYLELRSLDMHCIVLVKQNIEKYGIRLGQTTYRDVQVELFNDTVEDSELTIQMLSPICVYSTNPDTGHTDYWGPDDVWFSRLVQDNFRRKYTAFAGAPESEIKIDPLQVCAKDKYVTLYKDFYITGWKGIYKLSGERKYLDFLYQTGLGSKNAQGFGMFKTVN